MFSTNAIIINATNASTFDEEEMTSKYTPVKMSAWDSFKNFFQTRQKFGRHPFAAPGHPKRTADHPKSTADDNGSAWTSFKEFFQTRQKFGRHPFATQV